MKKSGRVCVWVRKRSWTSVLIPHSEILPVITQKPFTDAPNCRFGNKNISHRRVRPFEGVIGTTLSLSRLFSSHQPLSSETPRTH